MVRASSKSVVATTSASTTIPVVVPVVSVEKKTVEKVKKVKKDEVVSTEPVVPIDPVSVVAEVVLDKSSLSEAMLAEMGEFNKNYQSWLSFANLLKVNVKNIAKLSSRISKCADKSSKRRKSTHTKSGFEQPTLISDDLAVFFGKTPGTKMARTEVSKQIHEYVKANNLQNEANRRIIHPDVKLKKLLDSKDDELTYFNLQKYLKHHFKKEVPVVKA
jgi:chromatin remodeling complex protein RSC6